jgi:hypothetical protein
MEEKQISLTSEIWVTQFTEESAQKFRDQADEMGLSSEQLLTTSE